VEGGEEKVPSNGNPGKCKEKGSLVSVHTKGGRKNGLGGMTTKKKKSLSFQDTKGEKESNKKVGREKRRRAVWTWE